MVPSRSQERQRPRAEAASAFVIVGAGQAGAQAAYTLRGEGFAGRVILLGDEPQVPYQRPPLSKAFLERALSVERMYLRPLSFYEANNIELKLHTPVEGIDRRERRVWLHRGLSIRYDRLLLATGCRPRTLQLRGYRGTDVHYLRSIQDALRLRTKIQPGRRIVIVGGGYIGLEVAAVARSLGAEVTVLEMEDRLLSRVTSPAISDFFAEVHASHGVAIHHAVQVREFVGGERLESVACEHASIKADLVLIGIGAEPNIELAKGAGLECDDGIVVDAKCRTSDPNIYAAGDCTNHWNGALRRRLRLESVQNAVGQGTIAALNMMGRTGSYHEVPWFWSNQYEYKLQTAGCFAGYDDIEQRGDPESGRFALVYRKSGVLLAVDAVNSPRDYMAIRKELADEPGRARDWPAETHLPVSAQQLL